MSSATEKQQAAIDVERNNVLVSAGAGSGKTFVLKNRVKNTVLNKAKVDELIILTFTNAAAQEMKDRIRKVIKETPELHDQLDLVESAYITTFDSFAQSLVKKYNYLLNIDKNFTIIDTNVVNGEIVNIIKRIFYEYYKNPTEKFNRFINTFCNKDDKDLIDEITAFYRKVTTLKDKNDYLENFTERFFSQSKISKLIKEYREIALEKTLDLIPYYDAVINELSDNDAINFYTERKEKATSSTDYYELLQVLNERKPSNSAKKPIDNGDKEAYDKATKELTNKEKEIKNICSRTTEELTNEYELIKENSEIIIEILKEVDKKITEFKDEHNAYEFQDIALKATQLLKENEDVREHIKKSTYEIMIDEYQDTSNIQEEFIKLIANNNVYMVGDIKQSIYRFRYANPYIFKEKYDTYSEDLNNKNAPGLKINMSTNFRSREEVIDDINDIFSDIMFNEVGGAEYTKGHAMDAKFDGYVNKVKDYNYHNKIYNYTYEKNQNYNKAEIEAFIIAKDIQEKMKSKMIIVNGEKEVLPLKYSDFCILVDKSTNFELLKKILEYHKIPTIIDKEISIKEDNEVYILKNLITLLIYIKEDNLGPVFKHAFMSILRSYIYKTDDQTIYDIFDNNTFKETDLYKKLQEISLYIDSLSNKELLNKLIDEFEIFNKTILAGNLKDRSKKLEYFINNADALNKFGMDIYTLNEYFENILNSDGDFKMSVKQPAMNAVKIMTMHKSKGLEFPFVYLPYLGSSFKGKTRLKYSLSDIYGLQIPYLMDNEQKYTFVKDIYNYNENKETVSEKIRLIYVAATRAREQFIIINSWNDKIVPKKNIEERDLLNCKSFNDILTLRKDKFSKYTEDINLKELHISKDYNKFSNTNYDELIEDTTTTIKVEPLHIEYKTVENKHFSKQLTSIMTKDLKNILDFGTMMHYCFEVYDFNNDNLNELEISEEMKNHIKNFLKHDEVKNISNAKTYKEHAIRFEKEGSIYNGIIDLLVEYNDHFDIIDYKTNNIDSEEYSIQLNGYKDYIENTYNKTTNIYLYSIKKDIFKKI